MHPFFLLTAHRRRISDCDEILQGDSSSTDLYIFVSYEQGLIIATLMACMGGCLDFRTALAANSLMPFQLTAHTLDLYVKITFPTGGILASPHTLLLPLYRDLSPFHFLSEGLLGKSVTCIKVSSFQRHCSRFVSYALQSDFPMNLI